MKKALGFSINNDYAFSLGVVLLSIKYNSPSVFCESDKIVYEENISKENKDLLMKIDNNIKFISIDDVNFIPQEIIEHKHANKRWGKYIFQKFNCFSLLNTYEQILFLDTDIIVLDNIDEMFFSDADLTWIPSRRKITEVYNSNNNLKEFICGNGGIVLFNNTLNRFEISSNDLRNAFDKVNECRLSLDEAILICLAQDKTFKIRILPREYNNDIFTNIINSKILHFTGSDRRPWTSEACYLACPDWQYFYQKWLKMGGNGPINYNQKNFYNPDYTYRIHSSGIRILHLLDSLDIKHNKDIYFSNILDDNKNFKQFYILNLPKTIHFELIISGNTYEFCLHIEEQMYITDGVVSLFNIFHDELSNIFNNTVKTNKTNFIGISCKAHENQLNYLINVFLKVTLPKVKQYFKLD